jgi:beta-lactamase class A
MHLTRRSTFLGILGALGPVSAWAHTRAAITAYEAATGGHVGLYAENLASGARLAWRADDRFIMCSTFKASLAALVLRRVDRGDDHLDVPIGVPPAMASAASMIPSPSSTLSLPAMIATPPPRVPWPGTSTGLSSVTFSPHPRGCA